MTTDRDVRRALDLWLADGYDEVNDHVLDLVEERIHGQAQRPEWLLSWRSTRVNRPIKLAAAAAAVLVVAVLGYNLLPGPPVGPGASPSLSPTPPPTPTSGPGATGTVALRDGALAAGRYSIDLSFIDPGLSIVADVPEAWIGHPEVPALTSPAGSNEEILIGFMEADRLFSDPCHWDLNGTGATDQAGDVEVGPTAADLVSALQANGSYATSGHEPTSIGGFAARALELDLPGNDVISTCDRRQGESTGDYFVFPGGFYAQGPNSRWHLHIIEVDGIRLITMISLAEGTSEAEFDVAEAIAMSFEISP